MIFNAPLVFLLIFLGVILIIVPSVIFFLYLKSFNRKCLVVSEVGEDENDAIIRDVKIKPVNHPILGEIIKFHPFSPFSLCKNFDSKTWVSIKEKDRLVEGILLFKQGQNFRPVVFKKEGPLFFLDVLNIDNRNFRMQHELLKVKKGDGFTLSKIAVVSFFVFMMIVGVVGILATLYIMDAGTRNFFVYQGWGLVTT